MSLTVIQVVPALDEGGVERGTLEVAGQLVRCGHRSIVISSGGRLVQELVDAGIEHINLPVGGKSPLLLRFIPALKRIFTGTDIVHVRSRFPAWLAYTAWRRMNPGQRPRFMTTVHGAYSVNLYSGIMTRGERVIAVSDYIRDYISRNYPAADPGKIITIPRGIDPARFYHDYQPPEHWLQQWYGEFPQLRGKYILTLAGRISRRKGHEDFINVLAGLKRKKPDVHGLIVGGTHPDKKGFLQSLKKSVTARGLDDDITFTGHRDDMRDIMSISNIVLSLSHRPEAFGRTVLESLSLGTPAIAYDHGGAREILTRLQPGGLVETGDTGGIIERVENFYYDKPGLSADNPYTLQNMLDRTIACYEALAADKQPG